MFMSSKIRVGVLRGGPSSEYDMSLKTGGYVLKNLPEKYQGHDVYVDKFGIWHLGGVPKSPDKILGQVDVVWNALHGGFGENGSIQHILELYAVPHTGSSTFGSVKALNKSFSKELFKKAEIRTPIHTTVRKDELSKSKIFEIFSNIPNPSIVKPVSGGSSVGVTVVHSVHELAEAVNKALNFGDGVLVEEYIPGREATVNVIEGYRDTDLYVTVPIEIKHASPLRHYGFEHKRDGGVNFDTLSLTPAEKAEISRIASLAHTLTSAGQYSRSDFIVHPKRGVFLLEVNAEPALHEHSPFIHGLHTVGAEPRHFLDHVLTQVMK